MVCVVKNSGVIGFDAGWVADIYYFSVVIVPSVGGINFLRNIRNTADKIHMCFVWEARRRREQSHCNVC